ncbi:MAG: bifunctional phosphoribosylaminoimidazolecarboxamide formyltransferase/inosine monophosphate cyclohydrolase [Candidatus Aquicultor secundus]|uniref:bifunctional phosphoribosylaminoimidazolecarboxamide formyltransferase/IMP cyclohydrolase n=2 Tax=Candidatus Aquicultor secundus TaxID=1973895 RepID=UPI00091197E2|nr:bifunctional phosphoribosylaminoimidazolecarboxamide formyltransferase/IMP cyclohydrolase [Candidatus Aquicultor secundus]NCO65512.1 bifunctional phosphoribosylaminoimidazolecarboxamide formyltransferase/IMP cyclohydrolase [Solirubrobacter sp.]OIO83941.1 MAG: bifunctional phosphoribosylaminoimidazolecarboxamide formyltransferase/IMP cyclohydrolase [Candidatus Aquicultor secundus]PIU26295.1 MAG: bifunctional phosphoribosylaminoimidazolecarboxamide formyltransferase/inosine monophosphate cycloh
MIDKIKIRRAIISVSDKTGVVEFAKGLKSMGVEILSTGGTAKALRDAGVVVVEVSEYTGFPEMMEGRVKTLHPKISGGILADRRKEEHMRQIAEAAIEPIDLVCVNLYPFAATIARPDVTLDEAIENIDIGGPTMIRAAAKNFEGVAVVVDASWYSKIVDEMQTNDGAITRDTRYALCKEAFKHTAMYDATIAQWLYGHDSKAEFPEVLTYTLEKIMDTRYGENPHQKAAYYKQAGAPADTLVNFKQIHGKELSYNNILDMNSAWGLVCEFAGPACAIIKHSNPCGCAIGLDLADAYQKAYESDTVSAFGGIVALNQMVDKVTAEKIASIFVEVIIAPGFDQDSLDTLTKKTDLRLIDTGGVTEMDYFDHDIRRVNGGVLVQDFDNIEEPVANWTVISEAKPTDAQWKDMAFAWKVAKHVKSNAIIYVKDQATVGVGAGQMSRVDSTWLGARKGGEKVRGAVVASDAFFPFRDGLDAAVEAGAACIVEPGGSIRDDEVIAAANEYGIPLVFTGKRHFRH